MASLSDLQNTFLFLGCSGHHKSFSSTGWDPLAACSHDNVRNKSMAPTPGAEGRRESPARSASLDAWWHSLPMCILATTSWWENVFIWSKNRFLGRALLSPWRESSTGGGCSLSVLSSPLHSKCLCRQGD